MKIAQKLILFFLLFSLIPVIVASFLVFLSVRFYIRDQVQHQLITIADNKEQQLYQIANHQIESLSTITNRLQLQLALRDYNKDPDQNLEIIQTLIADVKQRNREINNITILDPQGKLIATTSLQSQPIDWSSQPFFEGAKIKPTAYFVKQTDQISPQLLFSGPITVEGKLVGIATLDTNADDIIFLAQGFEQLGDTAEIYLVNQQGPITPLRFDQDHGFGSDSLLADPSKLTSSRIRGVFSDLTDYRNKKVIDVTRYIDVFDLSLVAKIDQDEAYLPILAILSTLFTIGIIVTILAVIFAFYLSQSISRPILHLAATAQKIAAGDLTQRVSIPSRDELGTLAQTFNDMVDAIEKADKTKSEFIALASHQLRTPMSSIKWYTELLLDKRTGTLNTKQTAHLHSIESSSDRMSELLKSLLDISRLESHQLTLQPQNINLENLIKDLLKNLKPEIKKRKHNLKLNLQPNLPPVNLDPQLISQVYTNLLTNSIEYTPDGGDITITISQKNSHIVSQITDTGIGIPKSSFKQVFQKFFRAKNVQAIDTDGTGLGLYLAKTIVEFSGGKIWFESAENKGTTFWFTLPL